MDWHHSHVWCNTSSPDLSQIYCSEISGDVPDASHWRNGCESLRTLFDRPRDKGPSTIVSILRNGLFKTPRPLCQCFCRREVSCVPFFLHSSTLHCAQTNIQLPRCHRYYFPITLSPSFLPKRRPSRLQSLPFRRRRHAVTPLARSQP